MGQLFFSMNLGDKGRVQVRNHIYGENPDISIRLETQIEKWAFFRENTHRNFNYSKPANLAKGFFWLAVVPFFCLKMIMVGQRDGEVNNFQKPSLYWTEDSFAKIRAMGTETANENSPTVYTRFSARI